MRPQKMTISFEHGKHSGKKDARLIARIIARLQPLESYLSVVHSEQHAERIFDTERVRFHKHFIQEIIRKCYAIMKEYALELHQKISFLSR